MKPQGKENLFGGGINNKVLLYSTGNYIKYPVKNHDGKEYGKEYICVQLSHSTVKNKYNIVNQLYFNNFFKNIHPFYYM